MTGPFAVNRWDTGCRGTIVDTGTAASGAGRISIFRMHVAEAPRLKRWRMRCRSEWCPARRYSGTTARSTSSIESEKGCAIHKNLTGARTQPAREAYAGKGAHADGKVLC